MELIKLEYSDIFRFFSHLWDKRSDYSGSIAAFRKASSIQNDIISLTAFGMALYYEGMNAEAQEWLDQHSLQE